jgi:hypothetical protein
MTKQPSIREAEGGVLDKAVEKLPLYAGVVPALLSHKVM